jgi:hypothetical protein
MTIESELSRIGDLLQKLVDASKSDSKPATSAKAKAGKASSASMPAASAEQMAATSSTSAASESTAPKAESTPASGTSQASSTPTLDEVRKALNACGFRFAGDIDVPRAILLKYAKSGTLGSLAEGDRAKVIAELNAKVA